MFNVRQQGMKRLAETYLNRLIAFVRLPLSSKSALLEAALLLVFAKLLIRVTPYSWWSRLLGPVSRDREESDAITETEIAGSIARVIQTAARCLPWNIVCLPRAMVAKWMLARRNVSSTLVLGIRKTRQTGDADLHAWLRVGQQSITGGEVADQFTVIACYGERRS